MSKQSIFIDIVIVIVIRYKTYLYQFDIEVNLGYEAKSKRNLHCTLI